jgi:hypothetical protein
MHNLIYFNTGIADAIDSGLRNPEYVHHKWFVNNLPGLRWPMHITSRVHKLDTPWNLADSIFPVPTEAPHSTSFVDTIELIASEFCRKMSQSEFIPYIFWSGGLDSTSILVSLLKVADSDLLSKLVVVCSQESIQENAYFYYKYIDKKLQVLDLEKFQVTQDNYDKIIILDGEGGNEVIGWGGLSKLANYKLFDFLDTPWKSVRDLTKIIPGSNLFIADLIIDSIKHSPVPISTVYDFIWWYGFNYKFEGMLLNKMLAFNNQLTPTQSEHLFQQGMFRFYAHPEMQRWSMHSLDQRRLKIKIAHKWHLKDYIYQFDCNDLWYSYKQQQPSYGKVFYKHAYSPGIVAIDQHWNKYSITDASTRVTLGKILQRI